MEELNFKNRGRVRPLAGQSLLEVIIALAVGTITILAAITALSLVLRIGSQDILLQTAAFLEQNTVDNLTVTVERDWQQIANTAEGQNYRLATTSNQGLFNISAGADTVNVEGVDYMTFFRVSSTTRDISGKLAPGANDSSTKKVDIFVTWIFRGETATSTVTRYITRTRNLVFRQTDWSGGASSTDPVFARPNNLFYEASDVDFSFKPGSIKINNL